MLRTPGAGEDTKRVKHQNGLEGKLLGRRILERNFFKDATQTQRCNIEESERKILLSQLKTQRSKYCCGHSSSKKGDILEKRMQKKE